jgi:hypothetical protein
MSEYIYTISLSPKIEGLILGIDYFAGFVYLK